MVDWKALLPWSTSPQNKASLVHRYSYVPNKSRLFEQSLDVYWPTTSTSTTTCDANNNNNNKAKNRIVLLVVGSGWMGHQPWIYRACAWWNAAGPRTVAAALNCPCVCIRHRGAYFTVSCNDSTTWAVVVPMTPLLVMVASALLTCWYYHHICYDPVAQVSCCWQVAALCLAVPLLLAAAKVGLKWTAVGSATLDDMVDDVAAAMAWVQDNTNLVVMPSCRGNNNNNDDTTTRALPKIVFGGYSSGGHVAATLLQRPDAYWKERGLQQPDAVLYISAVLAVQPITTTLRQQHGPPTAQTINSHSSSGMRSFSSHEDNETTTTSTTTQEEEDVTTATNTENDSDQDCRPLVQKKQSESKPLLVAAKKEQGHHAISLSQDFGLPLRRTTPAWLTNWVCSVVWGPQWSETLPSPLGQLLLLQQQQQQQQQQQHPQLQGAETTTKSVTHIPHLLIENRHEIPFGLPWLDTFFCAAAYKQALVEAAGERKAKVALRLVDSDHWNILASRHLYDALRDELPALLLNNGKQQQQ